MLGDLIIINNFTCNPVVLKKIGKTSRNCYFWGQSAHERGQYGSHLTQKTIFWAEITKVDHKLSVYKISYALAFLPKRVPAITAVIIKKYAKTIGNSYFFMENHLLLSLLNIRLNCLIP